MTPTDRGNGSEAIAVTPDRRQVPVANVNSGAPESSITTSGSAPTARSSTGVGRFGTGAAEPDFGGSLMLG